MDAVVGGLVEGLAGRVHGPGGVGVDRGRIDMLGPGELDRGGEGLVLAGHRGGEGEGAGGGRARGRNRGLRGRGEADRGETGALYRSSGGGYGRAHDGPILCAGAAVV